MLSKVPNELLIEIISYCKEVPVLFSFSRVNKRFNCLIRETSTIFDLINLANSSEELDRIIALADFNHTVYNTAQILTHQNINTINVVSIAKLAQFANTSEELNTIIWLLNFANGAVCEEILRKLCMRCIDTHIIIYPTSIVKLAELIYVDRFPWACDALTAIVDRYRRYNNDGCLSILNDELREIEDRSNHFHGARLV